MNLSIILCALSSSSDNSSPGLSGERLVDVPISLIVGLLPLEPGLLIIVYGDFCANDMCLTANIFCSSDVTFARETISSKSYPCSAYLSVKIQLMYHNDPKLCLQSVLVHGLFGFKNISSVMFWPAFVENSSIFSFVHFTQNRNAGR